MGQQKKDRLARLLRLQLILWQYPAGIETRKLSKICGVSERTIYRDLDVLETELNVPIWADGRKRGVVEGHFLPPITFSQAEAVNIFLAARVMQDLSFLYSPTIASTFIKLSAIIPPPLRQQLHNTIDDLEKKPRDQRQIDNFEKLIKAWLTQNQVKILYQDLTEKKPFECVIDIYFIEPVSRGHSSFLIAYCHSKKAICTFITSRISGEVEIINNNYIIPDDFNIINYLGSSWGISSTDEMTTFKLHFNSNISKTIKEVTWHPSQKIEVQTDGSIIMTLRVRNSLDFRGWILGWANDVEVLEPDTMRQEILGISKSLQNIYKRQNLSQK